MATRNLSRFYKYHFIPRTPQDTKLIPISRTIGADRVVDEMLFCFTHDIEIDWMLPGIAPTGRYVEIPLVAIVCFRGDKLYHEHIYWDQASVLVQIGKLDPKGLPIAGIETAQKAGQRREAFEHADEVMGDERRKADMTGHMGRDRQAPAPSGDRGVGPIPATEKHLSRTEQEGGVVSTILKRHRYLAAGCLAACLFGLAPASAQEVTLRAANAFPVGSYYARNFEAFVKKVNDEGKGLVHINYIGGPEAIPTFQLANALKTGVVDLGNTTTSYTASIVPEGQVLNYTDLSTAEMRKDGVMDYLNKIFLNKGLYYYARTGEGTHFYIYTNKALENGKLAGLKIRSAPIYQSFFSKMGITGVQLRPAKSIPRWRTTSSTVTRGR